MKIFLTIFLFSISISIFAEEQIGRVVKSIGAINRINDRLKIKDKLAGGNAIFLSDSINVENGGYLKILMSDDTIFQLGSNSKFQISEYLNKKENRKASYDFGYGKLRSLFIKPSEQKLIINTPTVSMGVRGTEFLTDVYYDKNKKIKTEIALLTGRLELDISKLNIPIKNLELLPGDSFDSSKAIQQKINSSINMVNKIPGNIFNQLKTEKKIFLIDANAPSKEAPTDSKTYDKTENKKPEGKNDLRMREKFDVGKKNTLDNQFNLEQKKVNQVLSGQLPPPPPPPSPKPLPPANINPNDPPPPCNPPSPSCYPPPGGTTPP